jgi:NAD dependent epimerase/dehydratase family enzyme
MSCIHIDDVVRLPLWAMEKENLSGPVNAVMPHPVTNASFTRALGAAVHRPAVLPAPAFVLRALLGPMSSLLLDSSRVRPLVPAENGYRYEFTDVADALDEIAH